MSAAKVFFLDFVKRYPLVLDDKVLSKELPYLGGQAELNLYVEGLRFPDSDFEGLVRINLSLLESVSEDLPETPIFTDSVMFRMAPWIMTPNTLDPVEVFVCSTSDNYPFLKGMTNLVRSNGYKLKICYEYKNRGDRWMQDELEFGYIDSPHQRFPVVLDSPRDRGLADFPYNELLGSWTWGPEGHGAVVLVNCDSDHQYRQEIDSERKNISTVSELKDMSLMVLRTRGPDKLPDGYKLTLHMCQGDAERVRVFRENTGDRASNFLCEYRTD
ncbi:hypothetical protein CRUP_003087 [Coryphaenoides rupestris]|nr:hypothetical protein CRUP_003087 [Coryphaenoides rupestris]